MMNMRRIFLTMIFLTISAISVQAQNFGGGLSFGPTVSQISGDRLSGFDKLGGSLGFYTWWRTGEHWRFQMELYYMLKGSRDSREETSSFYNANLHTIEIPLIFQYDINEQVLVSFGPALSILANASESDISGNIQGLQPFNRLSATVIGGVGYRFNERWNFQWRAQWSLTPIRGFQNNPPVIHWMDYFDRGWRSLLLSFTLYYDIAN
jgi:hypothetical protein